jgi:hypothetical protein
MIKRHQEREDFKYITAGVFYGERFLPLVLTFIESWQRFASEVYIGYGHVSDSVIRRISETYPTVRFVPITGPRHSQSTIRISQKLFYWMTLSRQIEESSDPRLSVLFADIDTMPVRDPKNLFGFGDIVVTVRSPTSRIYLNSGVLGLSPSARKSPFIARWQDETQRIIGDPQLLNRAVSPQYPFGGADQMSLMELLGLPTSYVWQGLSIGKTECAVYNACENAIDPAAVNVLHLKAALQLFLLNRHPLVGDRGFEESIFQLRAVVDMHQRALARLRKDNPTINMELFRLRLPPFTREDLSQPRIISKLYQVRWRLKRHLKGFLDYYRGGKSV